MASGASVATGVEPRLARLARTHILGARELAAHLGAPGKAARYRRLLTDLGVGGEAEATDSSDLGHSLLFAEQPGCWYTPRDLVRARLRRELVARFGFDASTSCVCSLGADGFTGDGDKGVLLEFALLPGLGPARLVGGAFLRNNQQTSYNAVPISGPALVRLAALWGYSVAMLEAAARSTADFADAVGRLLEDGPERGLREILPRSSSRQRLESLAERLRRHDLGAAAATLAGARAALRDGIHWTAYWDTVNAAFLGEEIRSMSSLFARYLLAISDPVKMASHLIAHGNRNSQRPVSVAGFVDDEHTYRRVLFDPRGQGFFFERDEKRQPIEWQELRRRAESDCSARPSGTLQYLMLAAHGHYLLVDPGDEYHPFHEVACAVHQRATGLKFPWLTFGLDDGARRADGHNGFLDLHHPDFESRSSATISRFLATP